MIRRYNSQDFEVMCSWYVKHHMKPINESFLPAIGYIVPDVAAGFLYYTDSSVCMLEGFVTNPEAPAPNRHEALNQIIIACMDEAKVKGFQKICGFTIDDSILERATRFGFKLGPSKFSYISKEIK